MLSSHKFRYLHASQNRTLPIYIWDKVTQDWTKIKTIATLLRSGVRQRTDDDLYQTANIYIRPSETNNELTVKSFIFVISQQWDLLNVSKEFTATSS